MDEYIYKAIKSCTAQKPRELHDIIAFVDYVDRLIISYDELSGGLQRLIESGEVSEIAHNKFIDTTNNPSPGQYSGLSIEEYKAAVAKYHHQFREIMEKKPSPDDFSREKIVIRWKLDDKHYPTDKDEEIVEGLAAKIDQVLNQTRQAEVNGFLEGRGHIDILIFGKETDKDTDDIYTSIVDIFKEYGCPQGSYIMREYKKGKRQVISDVIT